MTTLFADLSTPGYEVLERADLWRISKERQQLALKTTLSGHFFDGVDRTSIPVYTTSPSTEVKSWRKQLQSVPHKDLYVALVPVVADDDGLFEVEFTVSLEYESMDSVPKTWVVVDAPARKLTATVAFHPKKPPQEAGSWVQWPSIGGFRGTTPQRLNDVTLARHKARGDSLVYTQEDVEPGIYGITWTW